MNRQCSPAGQAGRLANRSMVATRKDSSLYNAPFMSDFKAYRAAFDEFRGRVGCDRRVAICSVRQNQPAFSIVSLDKGRVPAWEKYALCGVCYEK